MTILCHFGHVIPNIHVTLDHFPITLDISRHFGQCHRRPCFLLVTVHTFVPHVVYNARASKQGNRHLFFFVSSKRASSVVLLLHLFVLCRFFLAFFCLVVSKKGQSSTLMMNDFRNPYYAMNCSLYIFLPLGPIVGVAGIYKLDGTCLATSSSIPSR